jgi:hypothetical protein
MGRSAAAAPRTTDLLHLQAAAAESGAEIRTTDLLHLQAAAAESGVEAETGVAAAAAPRTPDQALPLPSVMCSREPCC